MRIIGNPIGNILPKKTVPVSVCDYRYGAIAAVTQDTDTLQINSRYAVEAYGFKHNIALTAFESPYTINRDDRLDSCKSGRLGFGLYHQTHMWRDLSYSGDDDSQKFTTIPDFSSNVWTPLGATMFQNAVEGEAKRINYPNHLQDMYDISGGDYGYDFETDTIGLSNLSELYDFVEFELGKFYSELNRKISSLSYGYGRSYASPALTQLILGGRNSGSSAEGDAETFYGKSWNSDKWLGLPIDMPVTRGSLLSRASTTRWWDAWHTGGQTEQVATDYVIQEITKTISTNGWYNDFIHWHNASTSNDMQAIERFFIALNTTISDSFVWRASYGDVVEYLFFRESIKRALAYEADNKVKVVLDISDKFKNDSLNSFSNAIPYDLINTPISIEIDLSNTTLSGKHIKSTGLGIVSLGNNKYIVDIELKNKREGLLSIELSETSTPSYYDFNLPVIESVVFDGENINIVTDKPTNCVVFINYSGYEVSDVQLMDRSNIMGTTHVVPLTDDTKDIYIAVITKEGQSVLSDAYNFSQ